MTIQGSNNISEEYIIDRRSFPSNTEIVIDVIPEEGYEIQEIQAVSESMPDYGYELACVDQEYSFVMPDDEVIVSAVFLENSSEEVSFTDEEKVGSESKVRAGARGLSEGADIPVTGISFDQNSLELVVGETAELTVILSPEDATNQNVIWSSSDENVATVDKGMIKAVGEGVSTIFAKSSNEDYTAECEVAVKNVITKNIVDTGTCGWYGDNLVWKIIERSNEEYYDLEISGTGSMNDYYNNNNCNRRVPWEDYKGAIKEIRIGDGVTSIGSEAFENCNFIESIIIPEGVTQIGSSAFSGCSNLNSITIPASLHSIYSSAFLGCYNLKNVYISSLESWLTIDYSNQTHFYGYSNPLDFGGTLYLNNEVVTSITIPSNVTYINNGAFYGYNKLVSVTIEPNHACA